MGWCGRRLSCDQATRTWCLTCTAVSDVGLFCGRCRGACCCRLTHTQILRLVTVALLAVQHVLPYQTARLAPSTAANCRHHSLLHPRTTAATHCCRKCAPLQLPAATTHFCICASAASTCCCHKSAPPQSLAASAHSCLLVVPPGTGTIGLTLARDCKHLVGWDIVGESGQAAAAEGLRVDEVLPSGTFATARCHAVCARALG